MSNQGIYIYGFVPGDCSVILKNILLESGIYSIEYQNISAIVSDTKNDKLEYLDREALAHLLVNHQQKLEKVMSGGCSKIIPMQLGTIVSSGNDVIKIIKNGNDILNATFQVIENVEEIDVVAVWNNFSDLIKSISDLPQIKLMREELDKKTSFDQADSIAVGKLIKEKIDSKNNKVNADIVAALMPFCLESKKHEAMNDEMPLNYAFLVKKENSNSFMDMIDQLDVKYDEKLNFKIVGPLPCYSFYTIESKVIMKDDIENAKKILGIDTFNSDSDLKKAYRNKASLTHPDKTGEIQKDGTDSFIETNKAYKLLLDYSSIVRQSPENVSKEPLYIVKIKN